MKYAFVSILSTENYLAGILTMFNSLKATNTKIPLLCLIHESLTDYTEDIIKKCGIDTKRVQNIQNPVNQNKDDRKYYNYNKLNIFGLVQYDKVVYIDADMVIFKNIDDLFEHKHMSGTNAGGELPNFKLTWLELNSGLMVIEPNSDTFEDMKSKIGTLNVTDVGDQAFLHQYYKGWARKRELHISHVYNTFHCHLDGYVSQLGYICPDDYPCSSELLNEKKLIRIIHYIGKEKPWMNIDKIAMEKTNNKKSLSEKLWIKAFKDFYSKIGCKLSENEKLYILNSGL